MAIKAIARPIYVQEGFGISLDEVATLFLKRFMHMYFFNRHCSYPFLYRFLCIVMKKFAISNTLEDLDAGIWAL